MKIDFHCHFDISDNDKIKEFVTTYEKNETIGCIVGGTLYGGHDMVPNDEVIKYCAQYSGVLYPLAKINLTNEELDTAQLDYYAEKGVKGFKFIYPYYEYDHDLYMPIYEKAEQLQLPVLFHTGNYRPSPMDAVLKRPVLKNMDPINLDRIARSFPKLNIVMAHLGTTFWRTQAAELLKIHSNLYSDLAGCGSFMALSAEELTTLLAPPLFTRAKDDKFFNKLVFGSDSYISNTWPFTAGLANYQMKLEKVGLAPETIHNIMGGTVASWINL
jgi:predicted TIM-barrel fold metal-dependent hydrolase